MKKIIIIYFLITLFKIYSISYDEFIQNNEILLTVKKIEIEQVYIDKSPYRYPFKEYYIGDKLKVLSISPILERNKIGEEQGTFLIKEEERELSKELDDRLVSLLQELKIMKFEEHPVLLQEKNDTIPRLTIKFNPSELLYVENKEILFKLSENKIAKFGNLYEVEFNYQNMEIGFVIGNDPEMYESVLIKKLIIFINDFIEEMK